MNHAHTKSINDVSESSKKKKNAKHRSKLRMPYRRQYVFEQFDTKTGNSTGKFDTDPNLGTFEEEIRHR